MAKACLMIYMVVLTAGLLKGLVTLWPEGEGDRAKSPPNTNDVGGVVAVAETNDAVKGTSGRPPLGHADASAKHGLLPRLKCDKPLTTDQRLFIIVILAGALGAMVHVLRSYAWYVGNRYLKRSWLPMYYLLPLSGGALSVAFYLVLRGGLTTDSVKTTDLNTFGFAALAVLVGMFSQQATEKLKQIAEQIFTESKAGADTIKGKNQTDASNSDRTSR
jgi:hypothetical protein